jgi:hypothetical protein
VKYLHDHRVHTSALIILVTMLVFMLSFLNGCALVPDYVKPEIEHVSHISQHFGPEPTNYGYNQAGIFVGYSRDVSGGNGARAYIEAGEAYAYPKLDNMHEVFSARAGFEVPLK